MHWRSRPFCQLCKLGLFWLLCAQAHSATTYNYFYISAQSSYTAAPNSDVLVNIYLQEVNSDQSTNSLLAGEHGLFEAGVKISVISGPATITTAPPNKGSVPTGFDDPSSAATVQAFTSATITESTDPPPFGTDSVGVEAGPQTSGISQVLLGSVTVHTGAGGGQTSMFTITTADSTNGATFTNDHGYDLDNNMDALNPAGASSLYNSATSTNFSVTTTVPEPSFASILLFSAAFLRRRASTHARPAQ